jgi:hypothetical protein
MFFELMCGCYFNSGKMTKREAQFAAAALAWFEGNHFKAGALFESSLLDNPEDILAMKLAQDSYMVAGCSNNAIGCTLRHPFVSENSEHLNGMLLGMLATGHIENGRIQQAEDLALLSIEATRGSSTLGLHALLNCYQLTCRSSEMLEKLSAYESEHECIGRYALKYNSGCAHIMRGNYTAAFKALDYLLDNITGNINERSTGDTSLFPANKELNCTLFVNTVLLLWKLNLEVSVTHPTVFDPIWIFLSEYAIKCNNNAPMVSICKSMVLSSAVAAQRTTEVSSIATATLGTDLLASTGEAPSSQGWLGQLSAAVGGFTAKPAKDALKNMKEYVSEKYATSKSVGTDLQSAYKVHLEALRCSVTAAENINTSRYPFLRSVKPEISILTHSKSINTGSLSTTNTYNDLNVEWATKLATLPLSEAIHSFHGQKYAVSANLFASAMPALPILGGSAAQRDALRTMPMEA